MEGDALSNVVLLSDIFYLCQGSEKPLPLDPKLWLAPAVWVMTEHESCIDEDRK